MEYEAYSLLYPNWVLHILYDFHIASTRSESHANYICRSWRFWTIVEIFPIISQAKLILVEQLHGGWTAVWYNQLIKSKQKEPVWLYMYISNSTAILQIWSCSYFIREVDKKYLLRFFSIIQLPSKYFMWFWVCGITICWYHFHSQN